MVFPIGMYTACTFQLANALDLDFLLLIPRVFIFAAWGAWLIVFVGMLRYGAQTLRSLMNAEHATIP